MKKLILLLLIMAVSGSAVDINAQKSIKKLFCEAKKEGYSFALTVPGWLVRKGINALSQHTLSDDKEIWLSLKDKIKGVRFMVSEKSTNHQRDIIKNFAANAEKNNLELYASFTEGKNRVQLFVEEKKDKIKNLLFLMNGDEEAIIVQIKTDLSLAELEEQKFSFQKNKIQP